MNMVEQDPKRAKKLAKAAAKAAKKRAKAEKGDGTTAAASPTPPAGRSPAERSAEAAERQVALHRWRVILAAIGALIALITLLVMLL